MSRALFVFICLLPPVLLPAGPGAQQPSRVYKIGILSASSSFSLSLGRHAFFSALSALGYVEGKNILIEDRAAENK